MRGDETVDRDGPLYPEDLLEEIVRALVDDPSNVRVTCEEVSNTSFLTIEVGEDDVGKVIGKNGRTIRIVEKLMQLVYAVEGRRAFVDVGGKTRKRLERDKNGQDRVRGVVREEQG